MDSKSPANQPFADGISSVGDLHDSPTSWLREICAALACLAVSAGFLALWYWLKLHSLHIWTELSFVFMPLLIGVAAGCCIRFISVKRGFGIASFSMFASILAGITGGTLEQKIIVDHSLRIIAERIHKELIDYAKMTVPAAERGDLRTAMTGQRLAIISRLAAQVPTNSPLTFWQKRDLLHVNWFMSRRIVSHVPHGTEAIIWEPTCLLVETNFTDVIVERQKDEPIPDKDVERFRKLELPYLRSLALEEMPAQKFQSELYAFMQSRITWRSLATHGVFPFIAFFIVAGCLPAYRLARSYSDSAEN